MPRRLCRASWLAISLAACALGLPPSAHADSTTTRAPDSVVVKRAPAPRATAELARPNPQPSHGRTELRFSTTRPGVVDLSIYDITGRLVKTLVSGPHSAGASSAVWDGRDSTGAHVPNGLYFARLAAPGSMPRVQKIALVRG